MEQDARNLVGICGLYCGTCPSYLAYEENDVEEIERTAQRLGIPIEEVHCEGCLSGKVRARCVECPIGFRKCASEKGVTWCFQCPEFPCQRLMDFRNIHIVNGISHHAHVIDDLSYMKEHGIEKWIDEQEESGRCPQCGKKLYWFSRVCSRCHTQIR